ncbi:MAG: hypothetical protein IJC97_04410 [Oscillospiraceae bacterium]|nr:hypothetical protein [Oscillospiraceae bacterium]
MKYKYKKKQNFKIWLIIAVLTLLLTSIKIINKPNNTVKQQTKSINKQKTVALNKPKHTIKPRNKDTIQQKNIPVTQFYDPLNWSSHSTQIKEALRTGEAIEIKSMREVLKSANRNADFSGMVYKVKLSNGLEAVFKTTEEGNLTKDRMEEAAYDISVATGIAFVPPTVHRALTADFNKTGHTQTKAGFLSLFVRTQTDLISLSKTRFDELLERSGKERVANFKIFNFVFGNWDVGPHNMLISEYKRGNNIDYFPISIDNEGIANIQKVEYGEIPFVKFFGTNSSIPKAEFPFDEAKLSDTAAKQEVSNKLGFYPPGRTHNYIIWNGCYWAQFFDSYWGSPKDIVDLLYTNYLPPKTKIALKNLSKEQLFKIFGKTEQTASEHLKEIVAGILKRRDMLLTEFA